jgi:hypothetical protein
MRVGSIAIVAPRAAEVTTKNCLTTKCDMSLRSPAENENGISFKSLIFRRVRHSRMLLAGIQAESGLDPRLKHSGVTIWESHLFVPAVIFEGAHEGPRAAEPQPNDRLVSLV